MTFRVPPHVHHRAVHDEVVLLDARTDAYLGLNASAAAAWLVLAAGGSPAAAADELVARFEVAPEAARADVAALIEDLVGRGLLERIAG